MKGGRRELRFKVSRTEAIAEKENQDKKGERKLKKKEMKKNGKKRKLQSDGNSHRNDVSRVQEVSIIHCLLR